MLKLPNVDCHRACKAVFSFCKCDALAYFFLVIAPQCTFFVVVAVNAVRIAVIANASLKRACSCVSLIFF